MAEHRWKNSTLTNVKIYHFQAEYKASTAKLFLYDTVDKAAHERPSSSSHATAKRAEQKCHPENSSPNYLPAPTIILSIHKYQHF